MSRTTSRHAYRSAVLGGTTLLAAVALAVSAAPASAMVAPGTPEKDVHIGLDNDNAANPFIQPPGVAAPQHMDETDLLFGRDNADLLVGKHGGDTLLGGPGPDIMVGGPDRGSSGSRGDVLVSDEGDDVAIWSAGDGNDIVDGNAGTDTLIVGPVLTTVGGDLRLDTHTLNRAIPKVDIDGFATQTCELVPVPEDEHLGVQFLLRVSVDGVLQNTLRLKEMEAVVCPGPYARTARVADLTAGKPSFTTVKTSSVRGLAGAIVAPLPY